MIGIIGNHLDWASLVPSSRSWHQLFAPALAEPKMEAGHIYHDFIVCPAKESIILNKAQTGQYQAKDMRGYCS